MIRCALIGYGRWGSILMEYIDRHSFFELAYIFSPSIKAELSRSVNDLEKLLNDPLIKAVFIASPLGTHQYYASLFLERGIHVFCEKPLAKDYQSALDLQRLSEAKGAILLTNYCWILSPGLHKLKEIIGSKKVVDIKITLRQMGVLYSDEDVFETLGSHALSICFHLLGHLDFDAIKYSDNHSAAKEQVIERVGSILLRKGKIHISIDLNLLEGPKTRHIFIETDDGALVYDMLGEPTITHTDVSGFISKKYTFDERNTLEKSLDQFAQMIRGLRKSNADWSSEIIKLLDLRKLR